MSDDGAYRAYLDRFDREVGALDEGAYAKYNGHLVRKLAASEFGEREREYRQLCDDLEKTVLSGRTINNKLIKQIRERAAELVVPPPA
jgi:hypothetical protein